MIIGWPGAAIKEEEKKGDETRGEMHSRSKDRRETKRKVMLEVGQGKTGRGKESQRWQEKASGKFR